MIFDKIKEKAFIRKNVRVELPEIRNRLQKIRNISSLLAICPTPTKYNWLGVNRATHNMFPNAVFAIPQYYSRTVYSPKELESIVEKILSLNFNVVVFSGFCSYFGDIITSLKNKTPKLNISLIYHGSLSELAANQGMKNDFSTIIRFVKESKINRIGFVKKGLDQCITKIFGIHTYPVFLPPPDISGIEQQKSLFHEHKHIGVFANNQLRKNVHNQIAAALMIDNALVHTTEKKEYDCYNMDARMVQHPSQLEWHDFMFLMSQMDINLYNTYTETWGQIVVESIALGVPCITNNSSGVLDISPELKNYLVVDEHDNPMEISKAIHTVLNNREKIISLGHAYIKELSAVSVNSLNAFNTF